jgi:hypothetical protein
VLQVFSFVVQRQIAAKTQLSRRLQLPFLR